MPEWIVIAVSACLSFYIKGTLPCKAADVRYRPSALHPLGKVSHLPLRLHYESSVQPLFKSPADGKVSAR